jgi:hypothetical protein
MARKTAAAAVKTTSVPKKAAAGKGIASKVASSTPVRNTAIPKVAAAAKREITHQMIAVRAFEISAGGIGGSELDNWYRAERELRAGL